MNKYVNYLWSEQGLVTIELGAFGKWVDVPEEYRNIHCVDTKFTRSYSRYGRYVLSKCGDCVVWNHVPVLDFPPEFRAALLLLGVT